jgi:hypothetical protein
MAILGENTAGSNKGNTRNSALAADSLAAFEQSVAAGAPNWGIGLIALIRNINVGLADIEHQVDYISTHTASL